MAAWTASCTLLLLILILVLPSRTASFVPPHWKLSRATITITPTPRRSISSSSHSLHLQISDSNEDLIVKLPLLQAQLAAATAETNNNHNQETLQSQIEMAQMAGELGVRRAQVQFYKAFSHQDLEGMKTIWATEHDCQCIHPGMAHIDGRDSILESWSILFQNANPFDIEPLQESTTIDICGSTAICKCIETVGENHSNRLEALNIYKRERGDWKMTFHMASPVAIFGSL